MEMAYPSPARRAVLARTGEMYPLAAAPADSLTALLRDIQATIPDQSSTGFTAALNAAIARILDLLIALIARLGQPPAVAPLSTPTPGTTAASPSSAPAAPAHPRVLSRPNRARIPTRHPTSLPSQGRTTRAITPPYPHPPGRNPVIARDRPGRPRRRAAPSRAPPARNALNGLPGIEHLHNHNIPISKQKNTASAPSWPPPRHPTTLAASPRVTAAKGERTKC